VAATLVVAGACNRADPPGQPPPRSISTETYDDWSVNAGTNDDVDGRDLMVGTWPHRTGWPYESVDVGPWWPVRYGSDPDPTDVWAASLSVNGRVIGGLKAYTSTNSNKLVFSDYLPLDAAVAIRESPSDAQSVLTFPGGARFHGDHLIADGEHLTPLASSDWTTDVRTVDDLRELEAAYRDPLGTQLLNAAIMGPSLVVMAIAANPAPAAAVATVLVLIVVLVRSRRHPE
jgi:hypothetical protein